MKQETVEIINWIKQESAEIINWINEVFPKYNTKKYSRKWERAIIFLNHIPKVEERLCLGGYIQDRNGNPCSDGEKVTFRLKHGDEADSGTLRWIKERAQFMVVDGDKRHALQDIDWFERLRVVRAPDSNMLDDILVELQRLKEENRNLKNCENCKHRLVKETGCIMGLDSKDCDEPCSSCDEHDKWEAKE